MSTADPSVHASTDEIPGAELLGMPGHSGTGGGGSTLRLVANAVLHSRIAVIGLILVIGIVLFCFVGPLFYHTNQVRTNPYQVTLAPGGKHPLGTDDLGYDVLGRLMKAGASSLEVGLAAALLAGLLGTAWGAIAGFAEGWVGAVMMRVVDSLLAIPQLLLILLVASIVTMNVPILIFVIGGVAWLTTARLVRAETLLIRKLEYVQASRLFGTSNGRIILRHVVRNVIGIVVVQVTFEVANAILLLAALGFLGLGPPPPAANWGSMLANGLNYAYDGFWWVIYPAGIAIVLTVVGLNFIGDAIREGFDARLHQRSA
jgi:peptide/nickel transport system permease protein